MMMVEVNKKRAEIRWQVIPETCSDGYGSFGERKMGGDQWSRKGETRGGSGRAGWLNGEKLVKVSGLGGLEEVVGYGQGFEVDVLWDLSTNHNSYNRCNIIISNVNIG